MKRFAPILAILAAIWPGVGLVHAFRADPAPYQLAQAPVQSTWVATSPNCPYGMDNGDGCPEAPTTASYRIPNCWVGNGLRQSGQTWDPALGEHPPSWNVPGCDYPVGATTSAAEMLANPATYDPLYQDTPGHYPNVPASCKVIDPNDPKNVGVDIGTAPMVLHAIYYGWVRNEQMPMLYCGTQEFKGFANLYLGAYPSRHKAVGVFIERNSSANIVFQNLIFSGDQDVLWASQVMSGNAVQNVTFKHSSFNGNFFDPSGCCQSGNANWVELWNRSGTLIFDYVNISQFQGYEVTMNTGRTIPTGKGSISITHSVINGCLWRQAAGHGECFTGGPGGWNNFDIRYNLFTWYGGNGGHTTFFHLNSTNYNSSYNNVDIGHNLYISNTNGNPPPKILYHLEDAGPMYNHAAMLVLDGAAVKGASLRPGQCLQQGMSVQGTALNLWTRIGGTGCDAGNTKFLVDCAGGENFNYAMCPSDSVSATGNTYDPSTGKLTLNFPYAPLGVQPPPVPQGVFHPTTYYRAVGVTGCRGAPYAYATATTGTDKGVITWTAVALGPPGDLVNIIVRPAAADLSIAVAGNRISITPRTGAATANDIVNAVAMYAPAAALVRGAVVGDGSGAAYAGSVTLDKGTAGDVLNQSRARLVSYNNSGYTSITVQLADKLGGFTGIDDNSCTLTHDSGTFMSAVPYASAASPAINTHMSARNSNAFHDFVYVPSENVNIHDNFIDDNGTPSVWLSFAACNVVNMRGNQFLNTNHSTTVNANSLGSGEDYPGCTANVPGVGFWMPPDGAQWGRGENRAPNTLYCTGIPVTTTQNWEAVTVSVRGNWPRVLFQQAFYLGGTDTTSPTTLKPVGPPLAYSHSTLARGFSAATNAGASQYNWMWNKSVSGQSGLPMAVTAGQTIFHCVEANGTMSFTAFANPALKYELSNPYGTWPNLTDVAMPVAGARVNVPPIIQAPSFP